MSFTHFLVLTWDFFFNFKEDLVLEKFTLVIYAPSLPPPWTLSFLIVYVFWLSRKAMQSEISASCVYLLIHLYDHYTWDLLWALTALGTFYVCNHFLCTWEDLISTFLMRMPFTLLSCLVRLLSSSSGTVWKRSSEDDSPVLFSQRKTFNRSPPGMWPKVIWFLCRRGMAFWS